MRTQSLARRALRRCMKDKDEGLLMHFQNWKASFCWERGRLVRNEREARNDFTRQQITRGYRRVADGDVRALGIKFTRSQSASVLRNMNDEG